MRVRAVRFSLISIVAFLLTCTAVHAQPVVTPNAPITIEWDTAADHTLANGLNYRAVIDGTVVKSFVAADLTVTPRTGGLTYRASVPGVAPGSHALLIREYSAAAQADSPAVSFSASVSPAPPSIPRIITVQIAGNIQIEIREGESAGSAIARAFTENVLRIGTVK